jgi:murein DD-endopeptidase MepM/ murein hydrolase activator NlpD
MNLELEIGYSLKIFKFWLRLALVLGLILPGVPVNAQGQQVNGPVYVVQEGDSLWDIALRFGVSIDALEKANGITDPNQISAGARLVIPGLEGIQGELTTEAVQFGETLQSLSRRYQVPSDSLARLNHLTSPGELYAGASLVIPKPVQGGTPTPSTAAAAARAMLSPGQSLLELAVTRNANPWSLVTTNGLGGTWSGLPGEVLYYPGVGQDEGPGALPEIITNASLKPLPMVQGKTSVIELSGPAGLTLTGSLAGNDLHFFPSQDGTYVALQGLHALVNPGIYDLKLNGKLPDGAPYYGAEFAFSQPVYVRAGGYRSDPPLTVDPTTIDPAVTKPEDAQWFALMATATPQKLWDGIFQSPAKPPFDTCWPSQFGNRRSFNGSGYTYFHSGLDFCGGVGAPILAPAAGTVVFAGPLTVRGNATIIDHGWGVYTGYLHQSEIMVKVGDHVEAGQLIGKVGGTGRVTGPHLHWEVVVGGVQVDPMDWLQQAYP